MIRGWTTEAQKKFAKARAEIRQDSESGPLLAEADAMMFLIESDANSQPAGRQSCR